MKLSVISGTVIGFFTFITMLVFDELLGGAIYLILFIGVIISAILAGMERKFWYMLFGLLALLLSSFLAIILWAMTIKPAAIFDLFILVFSSLFIVSLYIAVAFITRIVIRKKSKL